MLMCFVGGFNLAIGISALRTPGLVVEAAGFLLFGALMMGLALFTYRSGSPVPVAIAAALILGQGVLNLFTGSWDGEQAVIKVGAVVVRLLLCLLLLRGYRALKPLSAIVPRDDTVPASVSRDGFPRDKSRG
jgi:hypothetical protein